jgi:hypothetical protein
MGGVEDYNDDNQSNSVGKGKLRVLCAFGDSSESVGSRDGNSGSGGLVGIKIKLEFLCPKSSKMGRKQQRITRYEDEQYWW